MLFLGQTHRVEQVIGFFYVVLSQLHGVLGEALSTLSLIQGCLHCVCILLQTWCLLTNEKKYISLISLKFASRVSFNLFSRNCLFSSVWVQLMCKDGVSEHSGRSSAEVSWSGLTLGLTSLIWPGSGDTLRFGCPRHSGWGSPPHWSACRPSPWSHWSAPAASLPTSASPEPAPHWPLPRSQKRWPSHLEH